MVRVSLSQENGISEVSEVNSAQIMTIQKDRLGSLWGRLSSADMARVDENPAYRKCAEDFPIYGGDE